MGLKLIIFLGLAWAVYALVRRARRPRSAPHRQAGKSTSVDMVRCDRCGTHLPKPEALRKDDQWYCCPEHRDGEATTRQK